MIKINNLKVGYENRVIIEDLSLEVKRGEVISIIGPNGSGKSTFLKAIARFIKKDEGEIYLLDKLLDNMKNNDISKAISMLSQQNSSPNDITVKELIYYGRTPHKK